MDLQYKVKELRQELHEKRGQLNVLLKQEGELTEKVAKLNKELKTIQKAQEVLQTIAKETQEELHYNISEITTLSLSVLDRPYKVKLNFKGTRNTTDCEIKFKRGDKEFDPMLSTGGAVKEMAAFALRCAVIKMAIPQPRPLLILDEPFRFLGALRGTAIKVLQKISEALDIQIILTTHDIELLDLKTTEANKIIPLVNENGVTKVTSA